MLRDHFTASEKKKSRSEQMQQKEDASLDMKRRHIKEFTHALTVAPDRHEGKCSLNALELSKQPFTTMKLQEAIERYTKLNKGISLNEVIDDNNFIVVNNV